MFPKSNVFTLVFCTTLAFIKGSLTTVFLSFVVGAWRRLSPHTFSPATTEVCGSEGGVRGPRSLLWFLPLRSARGDGVHDHNVSLGL